jgi:ABC-2 type transport system ATP-binding protein
VPAIRVEHLRKRYGSIDAVRDVSFVVEMGEIFALLGPNGAGKTTTIEILEGFRKQDSGRVEVLGVDPAVRSTSLALRQRLGIVLQELAVEPFLTVREVLARHAGFYSHPRDVGDVIDLVGLTAQRDARVKTLSGGQQRRLDVGLGIVGRPELVILDEPTTGFDPAARRSAWQLVRSLRDAGATILLTTHNMDEAEALADRVAVLAQGRVVAQGSPTSLGERETASAQIQFRLPPGVQSSELPAVIQAIIGTNPPGDTVVPGDLVKIETGDEIRALHQLTGWALDHGYRLPALTVRRMTLEDVYLRLTGGTHPASDT